MMLVARRLAWLLPLVLCACAHVPTQTQMQAMAPPIEEAPPPPDVAPSSLPQGHVSIPPTKPPVAVPPEPAKEEAPKHHKAPKPTTQANNSAAAAPTNQVAEAANPAEENALGTFETPEAPDTKKQAETSIADIEHGLNTISRQLSSQEMKTSMQIREFLKQARIALSGGDIEGAKTLAKKAQALLGELNQ